MVGSRGTPRRAFPASASSDAASLDRSRRVRARPSLARRRQRCARPGSFDSCSIQARTRHSPCQALTWKETDMIQVTERARETLKNRLELIERPDVMLRIGRTDSGLGVFPDLLKDDDQIIEHDGRSVLLIDQEVSETLADTTIDVEEHADGAHFVVRR